MLPLVLLPLLLLLPLVLLLLRHASRFLTPGDPRPAATRRAPAPATPSIPHLFF